MGKVDSNRCLLGDDSGKLHMLFVETEENMEAEADAGVSANMSGTRVVNLRVELLGEVHVCGVYMWACEVHVCVLYTCVCEVHVCVLYTCVCEVHVCVLYTCGWV